MKMSGEEIIAAPREAVWRALNDTQVLKQSIPGCEEITRTSATELEAKVTAKVGPIKAGFRGHVTLSDLKPPESYRISGKGEGGLAGFASGGADIRLEEIPEGTRLSYDVDATVGGKMAMLGSRLIDGVARSLAGKFFEKFATLAAGMKAAPPARPAKKAPKKKVAKKAEKKPAKKAAKKPVKKAAKKKAGHR
jgi:carbon monoxide dehydrogenase subunit G